TIATRGSCVGAVVATENIRCQRSHLLATSTALTGLILPRIKVKKIIVGGGHDGLYRIGSCGFSRTIAARKQIDWPELELTVGHIAPIDVDKFLKVHKGFPSIVICR